MKLLISVVLLALLAGPSFGQKKKTRMSVSISVNSVYGEAEREPTAQDLQHFKERLDRAEIFCDFRLNMYGGEKREELLKQGKEPCSKKHFDRMMDHQKISEKKVKQKEAEAEADRRIKCTPDWEKRALALQNSSFKFGVNGFFKRAREMQEESDKLVRKCRL